jgi:hypothetical protein
VQNQLSQVNFNVVKVTHFVSQLALGAHFRVTGLLIVWQVFMMIYIIFLFLMWIIIPITLFLTIFVATAAAADVNNSAYYGSYGGTNTVVSSVSSATTAAAAVAIVSLVFSFILPIVYIYFWIVVNNLRREFSRPAPLPPMAAYPQPMYNY